MPDSASSLDTKEGESHCATVLVGTWIKMQMLVVNQVIQPEPCWCAGSTAAVVLWRYSDLFRKTGVSSQVYTLAYLVTSTIL